VAAVERVEHLRRQPTVGLGAHVLGQRADTEGSPQLGAQRSRQVVHIAEIGCASRQPAQYLRNAVFGLTAFNQPGAQGRGRQRA
jgi:hypothetical protein